MARVKKRIRTIVILVVMGMVPVNGETLWILYLGVADFSSVSCPPLGHEGLLVFYLLYMYYL